MTLEKKVYDSGYLIYDRYLDEIELRSNHKGLYHTRAYPNKEVFLRNKRFKGRYKVIKVEIVEVEDDDES